MSGISDDEIDEFAAIAGLSFSGDDDDAETDDLDSGDGDDDEDDEDANTQPDTSGTDITQADIVATAGSKDAAVAAYAEICVSGNVKRYRSKVSGVTFYSASGSDINFDPMYGDPNLVSKETTISCSSIEDTDTVAAHYYMCSSTDCGAHIVSSNEEISHCPSCASELTEPNMSESDDDSDDHGDDFDFGTVVDQDHDDDDDSDDADADDSNEQALSRALSFIAGEKDVTPDYLDVSYCGIGKW